MDLGSLRIFYATGREGSVSKAAASLHCVQSNVTARIKQLEDELGVPLFYRKQRGMALTPSGKILMGYAEKALALFHEAKKAVQQTGAVKGPLHIGCLESTAAARMPEVLKQFHHEYPEVELIIRTAPDRELKNMVSRYQLDGAFVEAFPANENFEQHPAFQEELVILSGKNTPLPESTESPALIVFSRGCTYRKILENWFIQKAIPDFKIMEFGSHEGILGCVAAGLGITLFPLSLVCRLNYADKLTIHTLPEDMRQLEIPFIKRRNTVDTRAMKEFRRILHEKAGDFHGKLAQG